MTLSIGYWQAIAVAIVAAALFEAHAPLNEARGPTTRRILANVTFLGLALAVGGWLAPVSRSLTLWWADTAGHGLIGQLPESAALALVVAFLGYDLQRYLTHRILHTRALWRAHALHHSDVDVDWSTNFRHHPFETMVTIPLAAIGLGLIGIDAGTIGALVVVHLAWDVFVHANVALPRGVERALGWLFVTPRMHRMHHGALRAEADSNFGGILSIWDRLFGSYRAGEPARFGIDVDEASSRARLGAMLALPFARGLGVPREPSPFFDSGNNNPTQET